MTASVIHQNLAHKLGCDGKKMRAALQPREVLPNQPKISLMHQRCALQSVIRTLIPQVVMGQTAQFVVDQWQERVPGFAVASPPTLQELCDLTRRLMRHQVRPLARWKHLAV